MFQLNKEEQVILRSQFEISSFWGGRRYRPHAFTEQGVAMLSTVLRSERAIQVNVAIMRAFVRLRATLSSHEGLARILDELERRYDGQFKIVFDALRELIMPAVPTSKSRIGFRPKNRLT